MAYHSLIESTTTHKESNMDTQYLVTVRKEMEGSRGIIGMKAFETMHGAFLYTRKFDQTAKISIETTSTSIRLTKIKMMANSFRIGGGMYKPSNELGYESHIKRYEALVDEAEDSYVFGDYFGELVAKTIKKIIPDFNY